MTNGAAVFRHKKTGKIYRAHPRITSTWENGPGRVMRAVITESGRTENLLDKFLEPVSSLMV